MKSFRLTIFLLAILANCLHAGFFDYVTVGVSIHQSIGHWIKNENTGLSIGIECSGIHYFWENKDIPPISFEGGLEYLLFKDTIILYSEAQLNGAVVGLGCGPLVSLNLEKPHIGIGLQAAGWLGALLFWDTKFRTIWSDKFHLDLVTGAALKYPVYPVIKWWDPNHSWK